MAVGAVAVLGSACDATGLAALAEAADAGGPPSSTPPSSKPPVGSEDAGPAPTPDGGTPPAADGGATPGPDAGNPPARDAGPTPDAGTTPTPDAGTPPAADAGTPPAPDAGPPVTPGDAGAADVTFTVDTALDVRPISRFVYGKNMKGGSWAGQPNLTLDRLGGNRWTAYNWENNASNAGSDYFFHNDSNLSSSSVPGEAVRGRVAAAHAAGAAAIVTVPIAGWAAADKLGTDVRGDPITTRFRQSVSTKPTALSATPDTTDGTVYQDEFVAWVERTFPAGRTDPTRELFYSLDNEPDLWAETHAEIHPNAVTYAELLSRSVDYATAIKRVVPQARIFGFVSYGWYGYTELQGAPDANGRDFTDFFLSSMSAASASAGRRLLDVLDLHWYPEARGGGVRVMGEDTSAAVVAARVQAPRSLWDPTYVETSWIANSLSGQPIRLIPRMNAKIAAHYPGTKLAFTEYYYGGGNHISGAVAQADVLGVFGREGVFAANLWGMTSNLSYIMGGFAAYRSYDGLGGSFGDTSVRATTSDMATATVYASVDAATPNRVVLVAINKATAPKTAAVSVRHGVVFSRAEVYQLTSAGPLPARGADVALPQPNAFQVTLPAMSVTTLVLRP